MVKSGGVLEQETLDEELPKCEELGVGVIIGGAFNSGILATGSVEGAKYNYKDAGPGVMDRVRRIEQVCQRHGVPLAAAALQFPLGHPSVASVIPGAFQPEHVATSVDAFRHSIPAPFWTDLKAEGLLRKDAPTPGQDGRI